MSRNFASRLPHGLFERRTLTVARDLIGCVLVHESPDGITAGRIVETEAYLGPQDRAAHSFAGRRTLRNDAMFGPKGHAYIYFIYGMHWCFNVVTGPVGLPQAVLVRALEPLCGVGIMRSRLAQPEAPAYALCRGPGKLCRAMGITGALSGADLRGSVLYIAPAVERPRRIATSPRIGLGYAGDFAAKPWRFLEDGNPCISRPLRPAGTANIRRSMPKS